MLTIVIPAAGEGSRFKEAGYKEPKPLIPVCGKPMIRRVIDNVTPNQEHQVVVIGRRENDITKDGTERYRIISLLEPTQGAVDTILKAREHIIGGPILVANCDQLVDFDVNDFIKKSAPDGSLVTFKSSNPHHSYVKLDETDSHRGRKDYIGIEPFVDEIKEKEVISNHAVTGVYYFTKGTDFLESADEVIKNDERYKDEFYTSSVIKEMIRRGKKLNTYDAPTAILGTPEDLQRFETARNMPL